MSDALVKQCLAELQELVRCRCHPAYTGRGLHDPECECDSAEAVEVVGDRIKELEAKLAKATEAGLENILSERGAVFDAMVEAAEDVAGKHVSFNVVIGHAIRAALAALATEPQRAATTLAELKGETDE